MIFTDFIYYDLKVAVLITVFYLFYQLLLAHETMHTLNRTVLLASVGLSVVLPLCVITIHKTSPIVLLPIKEEYMDLLTDVPQVLSANDVSSSFFWGEGVGVKLLTVLLAVGIIVRLFMVARGYWKLHRLIVQAERQTLPSGTRVCVVDTSVAPFSWMHTIVLSRADWLSQSASVLAHEEAHVRHRHSYDVVVVEILTALQWFNPVVWLLRQELRTIHEYEADASVLSRGFDESQYIHLLMQKATGIQACVLANGINTHRTKKRIFMMLKPKSKHSTWLKALYVIPIVLVSLALTAKTVVDYETQTTEDTQEPLLRVFHENTRGRGDSYKIRHFPGVKFYHNGKEETIPNNRPIALEVSKTTLQNNGVDVNQLSLSRIPVGTLKEIHLDEVSPDHYVANFVTEEKGKTLFLVDGDLTSQEDVNQLAKEDIVHVDVINNKEWCRQYDTEADNVVIIRTKQSDDTVFDVCEQLPQFPGGMVKLMEFVSKNVNYPKEAINSGVQSRVTVRFIVEKDGSLTNAEVVKMSGFDPDADMATAIPQEKMTEQQRKEAEQQDEDIKAGIEALKRESIRVVGLMPKWTPGKHQGKVVRCKFSIPVTYRLN